MKKKDIENIAKAEMLLKESKEDFTKRAQKKANELNKTFYIWYVNHPYKSEGRWAMDIKEPTNLRSQGSAFFTVEPEISKSVIEILKGPPLNQQGGARMQNEAERENNILAYEKNTITTAFNTYSNANPRMKFASYIITFDKNAQNQSGEVKEVKGMFGGKVKSLQYTMTPQEIATLADVGVKFAKKHASKVLEIIGEQWQTEGYDVKGLKSNKLVMSSTKMQDQTL